MRAFLRTAAALVVLIALLAGASWLVYSLVNGFSGLNKDQAVAVSAFVGILLSYFTARSLERRRLVGQATLDKRVVLYEDFVTFLMTRILAPEDTATTEEVVAFFQAATPRLIAYSSNGVIKQWGRLRLRLANGETENQGLFGLEELLKAMRRDLGFSPLLVQKGDILRLFINDIDNYL